MSLVKLSVSTDTKFGVEYAFLTEELFNLFNSEESLIILSVEKGYNFPKMLDTYLEDLERFLEEYLVRIIESHELFSFVRNSSLEVCVVPNSFINIQK